MTTSRDTFPRWLAPLTMGQILDRAFRVYRRQFLLLLGIVAAFQTPLAIAQLIQGVVTSQALENMQTANLETMFALLATGSLAGNFLTIVAAIVTQFGYAALALIVVHSYLGQPITLREVVTLMRGHWVQIAIAIFFILVLNFALIIYSLVVPILGWFTGLGILLFVSIAVVPLVTPIVVLERCQALDAFRRVWELTRLRFWWVLAFGGVLFAMAGALAAGPTILAAGGAQLLLSDGGPPTFLANLVTTLVTLAVSIIFIPIQIAAMVIMYLDLRVRFEGLDLALQAAGPGDALMDLLSEVSARPAKQLVTRQELLYFFAITVVLWLLIGLLFFAFILLVVLVSSPQSFPAGGF